MYLPRGELTPIPLRVLNRFFVFELTESPRATLADELRFTGTGAAPRVNGLEISGWLLCEGILGVRLSGLELSGAGSSARAGRTGRTEAFKYSFPSDV